jgi:hypothetical protein
MNVSWNPAFGRSHPGVDTLRPPGGWPSWPLWPTVTQLQGVLDGGAVQVTNAKGDPLRPEVNGKPVSAVEYEKRIAQDGVLVVRHSSWHDLFNVFAWAAWPQAKAALNARHVADIGGTTSAARSPVRDALTGFDEDGVVVAVTDPNLERFAREFRWPALFWDHRRELQTDFRVFVFGHALAEKLLAPFVGITGKAIYCAVEREFLELDALTQRRCLDERLADRLIDPDCFVSPRELMPLPVLGLPGWWSGGEVADFYADTSYFRPGRMRAR